MNKEQRRAELMKFLEDVDWASYDYTKAPGANMKFPDFTDAQLESNAPWCPKHYNKVAEWNCVHVPDLNQIQDGEERRLYALYGVPVEWPSKDEDAEGVDALITELDAAKAAGEEPWNDAMDAHGILNDEHYAWLRGRCLGFPDALQDYEKAKAAIAAIDAAGKNAGPLLKQHGFRDLGHFGYFKARVGKAKAKAWVQHNALLKQAYAALDERFEKNKEALSGELAPFKGVSLEDWAGANAQLAQAKPLAHILKVLKLEQPAWDEINAEWMARMSRDTTATVATVYGQAFTGAGQGKFAAASKAVSASMKAGHGNDVKSDEPISFEDWIKIQAHMNAALAQGIDPNALLKKYDLNAADWGAAGGYWAMKMSSDPMTYMDQYTTLSAKYATAFVGAKAGSDIDF
jgi:hypothetical protein